MNMKIQVEFGAYFARILLKATLHIACANGLGECVAAGSLQLCVG